MENISRRAFLDLTAGAIVTPSILAAETKAAGFPAMLDHILLGCNDLDRGIAFIEQQAGVRPAFSGVHPGRGTQNALLSLGTRRYLEIIAPDPKQSSVKQYSVITKMKEPRLIGWAAHRDDLDQFAARLRQNGVAFEGLQPGSRQRPDGRVLHWKALRLKDDRAGLLPFFIEWSKNSVHPSEDAPKGCTLQLFAVNTPETEDFLREASRVELDMNALTWKSNQPSLRATIAGLKGAFTITS